MDKHVRNLAIFGVCSVIALAGLVLWYVNKPETTGGVVVVSENGIVAEAADPYRAFLLDEDFFDPEPGRGAQVRGDESGARRLYLSASSVMRDIRLTVLNENGSPVKGEPFYVEIEGLGSYKDLDQDGMIYIPDLAPGEYFASLLPHEGYQVPTDPLRVTVREQLEYAVMDDIRLYIRTEDEIDEAVEDTEIREASTDADETEVTGRFEGRDAAFGIDISKYQRDIDWQRVADAGVQFAIIRCGYRGSTSGSLVEDPYFERNMQGAIDAGISVGVYFFSQALTEVEAVEEASMAVELCRGFQVDYPIFIDVENAGGRADGLDRATRTAVVCAFCETVQSAGYRGGIYTSRSWFGNKVDDEAIEPYVRWLAEWRAAPRYEGNFNFWQYTSNGSVDGIEGRVDLDLIWDGDF